MCSRMCNKFLHINQRRRRSAAFRLQKHTNIQQHRNASSGIYIGSPSLAVLTNGDYVASHDEFGPKSTEHSRAVSHIFQSRDRGAHWKKISTIDGAFWSTLFTHRGALYNAPFKVSVRRANQTNHRLVTND